MPPSPPPECAGYAILFFFALFCLILFHLVLLIPREVNSRRFSDCLPCKRVAKKGLKVEFSEGGLIRGACGSGMKFEMKYMGN